MNDGEPLEVKDLEILSIIGFDGSTVSGFRVHPDREHVVYPIGNKVTILNWTTKEQHFLSGHTNVISAMDLSRSGKYIASGQINHIGFRASVIIWDFHKKTMLAKHDIHKVRVEAVVFSKDDRYAISLGGRDCGSIVVYDVELLEPLCGARASQETAGNANVLIATNRREACFISGGDCTLRVWTIDEVSRAVRCIDVNTSKIKRVILSLAIDPRDETAYCGTSSGDIMKVRLNFHHDAEVLVPIKKPMMIGCYGKLDPIQGRTPDLNVFRYSMGVRSLKLLFDGRLIVGAGDGLIDLVEEMKEEIEVPSCSTAIMPTTPKLQSIRRANVRGTVTSIQLKNPTTIFVCTTKSEIYSINLNDFKDVKLLITCHTSAIYTVAFPHGFSDVFATTSKDDVRIWSLHSMQELLRIVVPNFSCSSVDFSYDGKTIFSGWDDGIIRAFTPISGQLIFSIMNAHNKGVSALAATSCGTKLISGGCEGQVRIWEITPFRQDLMKVLKEHKGPVSGIDINLFNTEAVSSSSDGTCIIWDIVRLCRKQIFIRNTLFTCVKYYPTGVQILTGGSDRKIGYWEVLDGSLIRELEGSISEAVNSLDISPDGSMFLTGANDQIVKLWKYNEGVTTDIGLGHSGVITAVRFSPNSKFIVTSSASGSIFIWKCPYDCSVKKPPAEGEGSSAAPSCPAVSPSVPKIPAKPVKHVPAENIEQLEKVNTDKKLDLEVKDAPQKSEGCCTCRELICCCPKPVGIKKTSSRCSTKSDKSKGSRK